MEPFIMSVNNAGLGHTARWWADAHATWTKIYFDGDEHPHIAAGGALFVLYVVRKDADSAVGGIGHSPPCSPSAGSTGRHADPPAVSTPTTSATLRSRSP